MERQSRLSENGCFFGNRCKENDRLRSYSALKTGIPLPKLAIAWLLKRRFVNSVIIGVKNQEQLEDNMRMGDRDMPDDVWNILEEQTRPQEEYLTWFNKQNYNRMLSAAEFHDETKELL